MNYLPREKRVLIVNCLVEGMSIRATCRVTGASKNTVTKLLRSLGEVCDDYQNETLRGLTTCKRIQCDEIWSFVGAKAKNADPLKKIAGEQGDVWTWTAICADTKLVPCWSVGARTQQHAWELMQDLASRIPEDQRVQISTDGLSLYQFAVEDAFGLRADYGQVIKQFGDAPGEGNERRYSPAECSGIEKKKVMGDPDEAHISTSYVERQNLTMRMGMRRFIRLTNGFSKKVENHAAAIALHFMHYNSCRVHKSLRVTPAMEAGVSDHVWGVDELVALLEEREQAVEAAKGPRRTRGKE